MDINNVNSYIYNIIIYEVTSGVTLYNNHYNDSNNDDYLKYNSFNQFFFQLSSTIDNGQLNKVIFANDTISIIKHYLSIIIIIPLLVHHPLVV